MVIEQKDELVKGVVLWFLLVIAEIKCENMNGV